MYEKFFTDLYTREESNVIAFGVPLGKNSAAALGAIRDASWFVEPFDIDKKQNLSRNVKIFDDGNMELKSLGDITKKVSSVISENKIPLMFGGNHLSSLFSIPAFPENTKVVIFDAHGDLKDEYDDEKVLEMNESFFDKKINDTTWLKRLAEKIDPKNIFLVGVRSIDEDEFEFLEKNKINFVTSKVVKEKVNEVRTALWQFTADSNVYISLDIDVFDPSIAPAVDYVEHSGLQFTDFQQLMVDINGKIVGIDACCINPIPGNQLTETLAVKSIFEIFGKI